MAYQSRTTRTTHRKRNTMKKKHSARRQAPSTSTVPAAAIRVESGITKNQIISELAKSPHGDLAQYLPLGRAAADQDPEFLAHLIAWNHVKGQVRDSQVGMPVASLSIAAFPGELRENSLAHLAMLGPRELLRAVRFAWQTMGRSRISQLRDVVEKYLRQREESWRKFDQVAVLHRSTLKEMYALLHLKPSPRADRILFKGDCPAGSVFEAVSELSKLPAADAAQAIMKFKIPFLVAQGALGKRIQEPDLALAIIDRMTPTEVVTSTKLLERLGMKQNPALRGAYEKKLEQVAGSKKSKATLKTTRAAQAMEASGDVELAQKLHGTQQRQLQNMGVEGNWLVLGDKSGSMVTAIETAKHVAATLAAMVKGKVWLCFFDTSVQCIDVTATPLDAILKATQYVRANGGTCIGAGLERMMNDGAEIDGIAVVSDGGDHQAPWFHDVHKRYSEKLGKQVPVYFYQCTGETDTFTARCNHAGVDVQTFDLRAGADYYSLPNLVATMRTNRYSLVDEIMAQPLITLSEVFKSERKEEAYAD